MPKESITEEDLKAALPDTTSSLRLKGLEGPVDVYRDRYGIPHVRAESVNDAFFGQGFATAQDRLWHMEHERRFVYGRWAEYVGESAVVQDMTMRRFQVQSSVLDDYRALNAETTAALDAYAAGVNAFIESTTALPVEYSMVGAEPERWEPWDCIAAYKRRHLLFGVFEAKLWRAKLVNALGPERAAAIIPGYQPGSFWWTVPSEVNGRTQFDYETDANNFAPHLALAWAPGGGDTVIRAGYGISFGHIFPGTYQLARFNPPAVSTITVQNPSLSDPLEGVSSDPGEVQRSELRLLSPDLVSSYGHQYNLVIQRRLSQNLFFQIGYVGNRTHKLYFPFVSNRAEPVPGIPATLETIDERRPDQRFFDVQTVINSGTAYYDGLKVGLTRSLTHGLAFGVNYFFSKSLSNTTDFATTLNREIAFLFNQHNQDFHADLRGPTPFDHRHILTVRYSYDFPFEFSNGLLSTLLEGWQIAGVSEYRTGLWYRIKSSSDAPGFGNVDGVRDDRPNVVNPDILGKTFDNPDTAPDLLKPEFFNTDIPAGGGGDSPFFGFRRAPINNTNLALTKSFTLFQRERLLQFRMEARNMLNRAWFGRPGDIFPSEVFGKIIHTQNKGRVIQFMIRLNF